ncbi:sigma factor [Streptomyces celluloflavus]|uniref:sigma factor n=1 Tax=Streptomyces celluloflavus TaxID=58344 RepID=UPI0036B6B429
MSDAVPDVAVMACEESPADAYAALYEQEHPRLVGYARSLTSNAWLAEDLVAEAHFRVWRRIQGGHHIDNVPAYLRTTIRHLATTVGANAAREIPRDPEGGHAWPEAAESAPGTDPMQRIAYVDLLARVLDQLPQRWVKALWLAEAEDQSLEAVGKAIGAGKGATAVLLHRAREGMRQAFLRTMPGAPDNPACAAYWERMPAFVRGEATDKQAGDVDSHLLDCPDCHGRMRLLAHANHRLPALTGPALLVFLTSGSAKFLLALAGTGAAAAGSGTPPSGGGALKVAQRSVRHLLRGQVRQAGPLAVTVAGVGVVAVAGAAVAAGLALTGNVPGPPQQRAAAPSHSGGGEPPQPASPGGASGGGTGGAPGGGPGTAAGGAQGAGPSGDQPQSWRSEPAPSRSVASIPSLPSPLLPLAPAEPGTPGLTPKPSVSAQTTAPTGAPPPSPTTGPTTGPTSGPTTAPTVTPRPPTPTPPRPTPTFTPTDPTPSVPVPPTAEPSPDPTSSLHCGWHWWGSTLVWICTWQ